MGVQIPTRERAILRVKGAGSGHARTCPAVDILKQSDSEEGRTGTVRMPTGVYQMGVHIVATWWIRLNRMLFYQSYWHLSAFIFSFTVNDVNNCVFVCSNAMYILLRCCNRGLPVINKRMLCCVMCAGTAMRPYVKLLWTLKAKFHYAS